MPVLLYNCHYPQYIDKYIRKFKKHFTVSVKYSIFTALYLCYKTIIYYEFIKDIF